jgi:hypothetical protein
MLMLDRLFLIVLIGSGLRKAVSAFAPDSIEGCQQFGAGTSRPLP